VRCRFFPRGLGQPRRSTARSGDLVDARHDLLGQSDVVAAGPGFGRIRQVRLDDPGDFARADGAALDNENKRRIRTKPQHCVGELFT
jgi:hypothetical protein